MSLVSLVKIKDYNIKQAMEEALNLIGYNFPSNVGSIVIKPNLCYYWDYTTGQTTDPKFVAALIDLIREKISSDVSVSIVESDASAMKCKYVFKMLGYEKLADEYKIKLVNLSQDSYEKVQVRAGKRCFNLMIPETIKKADLKINVPKIKYAMDPIKLTCALKNIFGCNPYPKKYQFHPILEEAIVAINKAMKFDLHIIDGIIVSGVKPRRLNLIIASMDPVAIDTVAAKIAGINPKKIKYLQLANKEGLGNNSYILKGAPLSQFRKAYPRKSVKRRLMDKAYKLLIRVGLGERLRFK
ncbi:MAG: DUF362 domain-containing protein [Candidatus Aenigmatarchaeota archaeon]